MSLSLITLLYISQPTDTSRTMSVTSDHKTPKSRLLGLKTCCHSCTRSVLAGKHMEFVQGYFLSPNTLRGWCSGVHAVLWLITCNTSLFFRKCNETYENLTLFLHFASTGTFMAAWGDSGRDSGGEGWFEADRGGVQSQRLL